jgi:hypothetical protein
MYVGCSNDKNVLQQLEKNERWQSRCTWVSNNKCVTCFSWTLGAMRFFITLDLFGLTLVSLFRQSNTHETNFASTTSLCCFQIISAHCEEEDNFIFRHLYITKLMFIRFVSRTIGNSLTLITSLLRATFNKVPLHANFSLDCTPLIFWSLAFKP